MASEMVTEGRKVDEQCLRCALFSKSCDGIPEGEFTLLRCSEVELPKARQRWIEFYLKQQTQIWAPE